MRFRSALTAATATCFACAVVGCLSLGDGKSLSYPGDAELQSYIDKATEARLFPLLDEEYENESIITRPPRRIRHPKKEELRNLTLAESIQLAMANNKIIRIRGQFLSPQNPLLVGPNRDNNSVYDPAIQATTVRFGGDGEFGRGLNAALAEFDANLITTLTWGRNETVQNNRFLAGGLDPGDTLSDETGAANIQLEKQMADGGIFTVSHNWNYSLNNVPSRLFGSSYTGTLQFDYRRPLWAGAGTEFTRVVGPVGRNLQNLPTVFQGVVLARINNDITLTSFEMNVRNMLKDVEDAYWDLLFAYRTYHSEVIGRDSALGSWRIVKANYDAGRPGFGTAEEAQARESYFRGKAAAETALANLYAAESDLRRMLGLPVNDGRILRPADEPATAEFQPEWRTALVEALTRRVELRRQKWNIKSLELQRKAAESLTKPRLDLTSSYGINAFGDKLLAKNDTDGVTRHGLRSAYGTLTQGDQTRWQGGLEFWMPLGFRQARTQVRNFEFRLVKARAALAAQEHEISHELANAFQNLDRYYQNAKTNFNLRRAAEARVRSLEAVLDTKPQLLDPLLRAQINLSQADIAYHRSVVEYNKTITDLHYRKGTLLETDMVSLAEGLWDPAAYDDALRRAWARSNGIDNSQQLRTEPEVFETRDPGATFIDGMGPTSHSIDGGIVPPAPNKAPKPGPKPTPKTPSLPKITKKPEQPFGDKPIDLNSNNGSITIRDRQIPDGARRATSYSPGPFPSIDSKPAPFSAKMRSPKQVFGKTPVDLASHAASVTIKDRLVPDEASRKESPRTTPTSPRRSVTPSLTVPETDERFTEHPLKRFPNRSNRKGIVDRW